MYFVKIGDRAINMDNVVQIEPRNWNDCTPTKVHFVGHNSPLVLGEAEAKALHDYVEYVAERPIGTP